MAVDATGLRKKVNRYADDLARAASRDVEQQVRDKIGDLRQWDYTHRPRDTFPPHLALHGTEFDGPDDPVLANPESFPPVSHYHPGDHKGCLCQTRPSRRGVRRVGAGPRAWRIISNAPKIAAARVGRSRVAVNRLGVPEWAARILNRTTWVEALNRARQGVRL